MDPGEIMRPLRIGINTLFRGKPTGVANYIINLVKYLTILDRHNEYSIFMTESNRKYFDLRHDNFHQVICSVNTENPIARRIWEQTVFPHIVKNRNLDILHCPMNVIPVFTTCKCIVTLLDCQYFQDSPKNTFLRKNFNKMFMRLSLKKADAAITISGSMKQNIHHYLGRNGKDIHVIHLGQEYSDLHKRILNPDRIKRTLKISGKYIIFVGYPSYRKNVSGLVRGFALALKKVKDPCDLVICGDIHEKVESDYVNILRTINEFGVEKHVKFTGYLEVPDMLDLMAGAEFLALPSFYEGFGIPVIEAMACGIPVLVSDIPVMRELVADAGVYMNPYDDEDISRGILKLLSDENIKEILRNEGRKRASQFTWENTALKTLDYYRQIAEEKIS
jgi:glycosyltransferase involved in cell wall biosynthesis